MEDSDSEGFQTASEGHVSDIEDDDTQANRRTKTVEATKTEEEHGDKKVDCLLKVSNIGDEESRSNQCKEERESSETKLESDGWADLDSPLIEEQTDCEMLGISSSEGGEESKTERGGGGSNDDFGVNDQLEKPRREPSKDGEHSSESSFERSSPVDGWDSWSEFNAADIAEAASSVDASDAKRKSLMEKKAEVDKLTQQSSNEKQSSTKLKPEAEESGDAGSLWGWKELTQAISSVSATVEATLGLPSPEEMASKTLQEATDDFSGERKNSKEDRLDKEDSQNLTEERGASASFFDGLSDVGTSLVSAPISILESLGKKTFEQLTLKSETSKRRRFFFAPNEGESLSTVLKELRDSQCGASNYEDMKTVSEARELSFIDLFEKHSGLMHLEGLEYISGDCFRRLPSYCQSQSERILTDALCRNMDSCENIENWQPFLKSLFIQTGLSFKPDQLIECEKRCRQKENSVCGDPSTVYNDFIELIAELSANYIETIHKLGQLMLIAANVPPEEPFSKLLSYIGGRFSSLETFVVSNADSVGLTGPDAEEMMLNICTAANDAYRYAQQSIRLLRPLFFVREC